MNSPRKRGSRVRQALTLGATVFIGHSVVYDIAALSKGNDSVDAWRYIYAAIMGVSYWFWTWFFSDENEGN